MPPDADAEALSTTRLEGSRWPGGRLWSWKWDLRAWVVVDRGAVGARAAAARIRRVARTDTTPDVTGWQAGSRHTAPDTWATREIDLARVVFGLAEVGIERRGQLLKTSAWKEIHASTRWPTDSKRGDDRPLGARDRAARALFGAPRVADSGRAEQGLAGSARRFAS